ELEVSVAREGDAAIDDGEFVAGVQTKVFEKDGAVLQGEPAFAEQPARYAGTRGTRREAGVDVPTAKLDVFQKDGAPPRQAAKKLVAADARGREMDAAGRRACEAAGNFAGNLSQIDAVKISGEVIGGAREEAGIKLAAKLASGPLRFAIGDFEVQVAES